ncbi:MAG: Crp/Fnr family transcriptional regulator [Bacilli bacterium]|nr:Crp/Fnr family transcriptional regulator [Bacilli bacterium]
MNQISKIFPFWDKLDINIKNLINDNLKEKTFLKGEIIHEAYNDCSGLIIVLEGCLRAFINSDSGKEISLYKLLDYDVCLLSANCVMKNISFDINLSAVADTHCYIIPKEIYTTLIKESKEFSEYVNKILEVRFSDVMWTLEQLVFHSMDKRIANYLLDYGNEEIIITHDIIANDLGTAREVVSRILKSFEKDKILELGRNKIIILNKKELLSIGDR